MSTATTVVLGARAPELAALSECDVSGLNKLYTLTADVLARNIPGDVVECGVFNGGSAGAMASALVDAPAMPMSTHGTQQHPDNCACGNCGPGQRTVAWVRSTLMPSRRLWLYDSFLGLPNPTAPDGTDAEVFAGHCKGTLRAVHESLRIAGFPLDRTVIVEGWFKDTLPPIVRLTNWDVPPNSQPLSVSILHIDADWHEPTLLCLHTFYDLVSPGGIIAIDDFGHWEGARHAYYDFIAARGLRPLLERSGHSMAWWVKGRENNREFRGGVGLP